MTLERTVKNVRRMVAGATVVTLLSSSLLAQTAATLPTNSSPQKLPDAPVAQDKEVAVNVAGQPEYAAPLDRYVRVYSVRNGLKPFVPHSLPQPVLRNSDRLKGLIRDGKLMLSLNDAVALALENNFDIAIARYNLDIANTDILLAQSGSTVRGVSTGLITGTAGGTSTSMSLTASTSGTGSGGTTSGSSGSASGSGGTVQTTQNSVGSTIDSYDPTLAGTLTIDRNNAANQYRASTYPESSLSTNTNSYAFTYTQAWAAGLQAQVSYTGERLSNNYLTSYRYSPYVSSNWKAQVRQHLLQGWGLDNNRREIIIAKNDRKVTDASFKAQVIYTVAQIQNIYWDLVNAYESVKVQQTALEYAQKTLSDNTKQVAIGTLAPIEVVSAKSQVAAAQQNLITAQTALEYQQLIAKNAIARNFNDPELTAAEVIPTDTMTVDNEALPPTDELVSYALANRPELVESELNLRNNVINNKAANNALRPTLDLVGYYGTTGLNGGFGDAFADMANRLHPDKGAYISLSVPLRNRAAQANQIRSELEYRQNQLYFQQEKNQINLAVRNAAFALQQAKAGVESASAAREYAQQSLEAEQKKYQFGTSTNTLVLQQQNALTQAASTYVTALSTYEKSRVTLDQVTATILDRNGISMDDAVRGAVRKAPEVPGLAPNSTPATVAPRPAAK